MSNGSKPTITKINRYILVYPQMRGLYRQDVLLYFLVLIALMKKLMDRMMFHVQDILCHQLGLGQLTSITLSSGDADVFLCLLYHFVVNWSHLGLDELWLIRNLGLKRSILPLKKICLTNKMSSCTSCFNWVRYN